MCVAQQITIMTKLSITYFLAGTVLCAYSVVNMMSIEVDSNHICSTVSGVVTVLQPDTKLPLK